MVFLRNVKSEEQVRISSCRLFHARAAATGKARSPRVARRVDGTCSVVVSAEQRHPRAAIGCQTGTPVLCHAHNGKAEHTTGTGFVPGRATSKAPVAVELCVLTSGASRQAERQHSARTAVGPAGIQRYPKDRVTLIQLGDDQCSDQCQQGVLRERPSHATDLAQCCKTLNSTQLNFIKDNCSPKAGLK